MYLTHYHFAYLPSSQAEHVHCILTCVTGGLSFRSWSAKRGTALLGHYTFPLLLAISLRRLKLIYTACTRLHVWTDGIQSIGLVPIVTEVPSVVMRSREPAPLYFFPDRNLE